jgi:hypothetical protein
MRADVLDERARRRHERRVDREPLRHRKHIPIAPPRGDHHPHPGRADAAHGRARGVGDLVAAVAERAIDVEDDEPDGGRMAGC